MKHPLSLLTRLCLLGIGLLPLTVTAQSATENLTTVTLWVPGLSYEKSTTQFQTIRLHAYMSPSFSFAYSSSLGTESKFWIDPAVDLQYRFYYNFKKRMEMNARVAKNSANFLALEAGAYFSKMQLGSNYYEESSRRPVNHVSALWGLQRNMPGRLNLNFSIGAGYKWAKSTYPSSTGEKRTETYGRFYVPLDLGIGIWLGKKD